MSQASDIKAALEALKGVQRHFRSLFGLAESLETALGVVTQLAGLTSQRDELLQEIENLKKQADDQRLKAKIDQDKRVVEDRRLALELDERHKKAVEKQQVELQKIANGIQVETISLNTLKQESAGITAKLKAEEQEARDRLEALRREIDTLRERVSSLA